MVLYLRVNVNFVLSRCMGTPLEEEVADCAVNLLVCLPVVGSYLSPVMRKSVLPYANNKGADQPAHPRSLISAFVVRFLDNIIPLVSISKMPILWLASEAVQPGLSLTWSETSKTGFLVTWLILLLYLLVPMEGCDLWSLHCFIWSEKTCLRGFRPGKTQTDLLNYRG